MIASLQASRVRLFVLDSWVQVGVEEVDEQIDRHDREGKEKVKKYRHFDLSEIWLKTHT